MKRKLTLMLALLFVWTGVAWSQGVTVKGVVTSEEDGLPIVGASVLVKGTTQGTITDVDGNFMISGVKADSKTLLFICGNEKQGGSDKKHVYACGSEK